MPDGPQTFLMGWEYVKWCEEYDDVGAIVDVMNLLDSAEYDETEGYAYRFVLIGEDCATESRANIGGENLGLDVVVDFDLPNELEVVKEKY